MTEDTRQIRWRMKTILFEILIVLIAPLLIVVIMGVMQGMWFDSENLLLRNDVEVRVIPTWQYVVYYAILSVLSAFYVLLTVWYLRSFKSKFKPVVAAVATVFILLLIVFGYMMYR